MANYSEDLNDYLKISPVRTPVVRKLHDRKQIEQRKDDPEIKDDTLYDNKKESKRVKSESSEENDSPVDEHSNIKSVTENNRYTSQSEPGSSRIPANLDVTIPVTDTESPAMSTVTDHTPFHFDLSNYVYYPSWLSTSAPVKRTEASTIDPWFKKSRFSRRNNRYGDNSRENVDGVAEATNVENEESHETPDESHGAEEQEHQSDEYVQDDQHVTEGRKGYLNSNKHNQDDKKVHDSSSEGSHDNESQQTAVSGDAKGKGGPVKFEEGGSSERKEEHRETDGEKGEKGYKSWHEHEKANKGHHDKERHSNYFDEEDGKKKEEEEEGGYHEEYEKGEKGGKESEFDEKGKHQKGYSTKGEHSVHKKDEFEKRTEFFDEFHEDGETENDGESHHEHKSSKGGHHKMGHHKEGE
ncbi:high mobility group nucleosome-binding domain-containing protein 5-like, partial [Ceratina calcarata]